MFVKKIPLLGFALLSPAFAMAQDTQLDDVVVTASRIEQKPEHVGSSMTVLTRETLQKRGDRTLVDALSRVPSVSFSRSGGVGGQSYIRMRGASHGQILVLIDGVRVGDAVSTEGSFDFSTLMAADIERIEILRGNQSALYGSDAIGGVINIFTHKREKGLSGNAFLEGGSFGTVHGGASVRGGDDKVTFGLSANHFHNDGFSRKNNDRDLDGNKVSQIRGNLGVDITDNLNISFTGGYELADTEYDIGNGERDLYYGRADATLHLLDDHFKNNVFFRMSKTDRHDTNAFGSTNFFGVMHQLGYQGDIRFTGRDVLTFGADYSYEVAKSSFQNKVDLENKSVFINFVEGIGDNLTLTLGGRVDNHQTFGSKGTYRSTLAYNIPETDTKFHGSYGTGFKAPVLSELYGYGGTPTLKPTETKGWDLGISQSLLNNRITADATYFETDYENMISYDGTVPAYFNTAQANAKGVEVNINIDASENVSFFGNYTFTHSRNEITGNRLERMPEHLFNIGTDISYKQFTIGLLGRYVGGQLDNEDTGNNNRPFFTADANVSYAVSDKVSLYARVDNILDHDYQETLTYNTPGVSAYGGIRINY